MTRLAGWSLLGVVLAALGCGGGPTESSKELTGGGSTFVYPLMAKLTRDYEGREGGCKVTYHDLGSGGGIKSLIEKTVDFGCTDAPMTDEELAQARSAGGEVVHVPIILGGVVPAYNLPNLPDPLRFTGPVLADIFLGKIKRWNDDALRRLNPHAELPDMEIQVAHRLDGSGTTDIWTDYLSKVSADWKTGPGRGKTVKWPAGTGIIGNEGVSEYVRKTAGSLGYVELSYAYRKDLSFGLVQNREGKFVKAGLASISAAANAALADLPDDLRYSLTDAPGKDSYPISGTTWAILYTSQPRGRGRDLLDFLSWVIDDGQSRAEDLFYARLPQALSSRAQHQLSKVRVGE